MGLAIGVLAGRVAWQVIADGLHVVSPGWRAARTPPAAVLRVG